MAEYIVFPSTEIILKLLIRQAHDAHDHHTMPIWQQFMPNCRMSFGRVERESQLIREFRDSKML